MLQDIATIVTLIGSIYALYSFLKKNQIGINEIKRYLSVIKASVKLIADHIFQYALLALFLGMKAIYVISSIIWYFYISISVPILCAYNYLIVSTEQNTKFTNEALEIAMKYFQLHINVFEFFYNGGDYSLLITVASVLFLGSITSLNKIENHFKELLSSFTTDIKEIYRAENSEKQ